jgi:hypothetical protein
MEYNKKQVVELSNTNKDEYGQKLDKKIISIASKPTIAFKEDTTKINTDLQKISHKISIDFLNNSTTYFLEKTIFRSMLLVDTPQAEQNNILNDDYAKGCFDLFVVEKNKDIVVNNYLISLKNNSEGATEE